MAVGACSRERRHADDSVHLTMRGGADGGLRSRAVLPAGLLALGSVTTLVGLGLLLGLRSTAAVASVQSPQDEPPADGTTW